MGRRSAAETTGAIFVAFLSQRTWKQSELARRVNLSAKALRANLAALERAMPLERQEDDDGVYWSVPRGWFPEAVALPRQSVVELLRLLKRSPKSPTRDKLLAKILGATSRGVAPGDTVESGRLAADEHLLDAVQDAADRGVVLELRYFTASRGDWSDRHVSVLRLHPGPRSRFVGLCHRSNELRWFRVDNIMRLRVAPNERFRTTSQEALATFERESTGGFHEREAARELTFLVAAPDARWVRLNLLEGMHAADVDGGIRVSVMTAAPIAVARFVVQLGGLARPETLELSALVTELAKGALEAAQGARKQPP